jgi:hypothetical protein
VELGAADRELEDDVKDEAASEDPALELVTDDADVEDVTVLDVGALKSDELVWLVDWAAKSDVEEDEALQSVAGTVTVTVTGELAT